MRVFKCARYLLLIFSVAFAPAFVRLLYDGFKPPTAVPFGISMEEIYTHQEPIVWVDARESDLFQEGHVPGALNLNQSNWDKSLPDLFEAYAPGKSIVVYCSPDCVESEEIASKIRALGLDKVFILEGGFEAWQESHRNL